MLAQIIMRVFLKILFDLLKNQMVAVKTIHPCFNEQFLDNEQESPFS